ncbi:MAG: phosphoribosylformylglycinamidine synthase II [Candidatus Aminicenantes bacterium RBG_16_63_16]|nr:MAG: phosphoribosylformylglycinamidine synthase II [Candidatus Aminicenantes bacterium RBG_16_63_16]
MIDAKLLADHNLTQDEYARIVELIGREPNITELGIFSLMWSEHCSYKSSKVFLKRLPTKGKYVIQGPGENAGIIDIGGGLAIVFKIESHNHPSFLEPFQGAATGVGGILRDIFTMGARPIAVLDSLRFGPLDNPRNRAIMDGVVAGISSYGNSFGVPTVGGEVYFQEGYAKNPLVNVFCLGLVRKDKIFYAKAEGVGNPVLYVGSKTGRDGIHGATMASAEFGKETEQKRPNVQVGDPFKEKLLLEACLEVMDRGLIIGIQDMGAAGLTCSTTEMAAKAGNGIVINLDLVPQREEGMTPYEIMLSESQERMLLVCSRENMAEVQRVFAKWDLEAVNIGEVTGGGQVRVTWHGEMVVDVPVSAVVDLCPAYTRPSRRPEVPPAPGSPETPPPPSRLGQVLLKVMADPNLADKKWVYRQYDHMVQTNTVLLPGADAAVLRIKGQKRALAMTLDGNSLYSQIDSRAGGRIAVAEACRNLACVGARPIGVTNCLNFGNPEKPEVMWQFEEAVEGIAEACRAFEIPVTGGNVSFYNDTEGASIYPTPVLGIVGLIRDIGRLVGPGFKKEGDLVVLLGETREEVGGSQYMRIVHGRETGPAPALDLDAEKRVHEVCIAAIERGLVRSAHDVSDGGLAVCVAESSILSPAGLGCTLDLDESVRVDALLFGESQSRIVVSLGRSRLSELRKLAARKKVGLSVIGRVGGHDVVARRAGRQFLRDPVARLRKAWEETLPRAFSVR